MALKKGTRVSRGYATVAVDDGINYRVIADTMTELGFSMNHSSARNYVLRVMRKFVKAFTTGWGIDLTEEKLNEVAKSPAFQYGIAELLQTVELERRRANRLLMGNRKQNK